MRGYRFVTLKYLPKRVVTSTTAIVKLLYFKPTYLLIAAASSVLFYEIIFWFLNLGIAQYLLVTPYLTVLDKLGIVLGSYSGIFTYPLSALAMMLFSVSVLQGVTISSIVYAIRHERESNRGMLKNIGGTGVAGLLSVLGLGCAACGTSLVTPILTFLFASSSVALAEKVGFYAALLALVVAIVTAYLAGLKLAARLSV
jgi:hypothetical protein